MAADYQALYEAKCDELTTLQAEHDQSEACWAAVVSYTLDNQDLDFLRNWSEGEFDDCRREWPDAPKECYAGADPLYKDDAK